MHHESIAVSHIGDDNALQPRVKALADHLLQRQWRLAVAESCSGGWLAKLCTDLAGSSAWFECGIVSYANHAKQRLLGVDSALIDQHGAVSEACVAAMARGLLAVSSADLVVAISGIAGPGGGTAEKPIGTVCLGWGDRHGRLSTTTRHFSGDRQQVRLAAVTAALDGLIACCV
jgi:nicotinamide-nucleotide amidase